jgi:hypothetical protein
MQEWDRLELSDLVKNWIAVNQALVDLHDVIVTMDLPGSREEQRAIGAGKLPPAHDVEGIRTYYFTTTDSLACK